MKDFVLNKCLESMKYLHQELYRFVLS
jgi:hypothetical protein